MLRLFGYYRSSTSYRLRIALNLKGLAYETVPVNLLAAEQQDPAFRALNPFAGVPALEMDGVVRAQSMAILEWLDERFPERHLLPRSGDDRFAARELAMAIATELHAPLNSPVLAYLRQDLGLPQAEVDRWYRHWLGKTLPGVEARLAGRSFGSFPFGEPGYFECVAIPQLYNARRFGFDLAGFPALVGIEAACLERPEFRAAHPDNQPDAPPA
ncbi:maleylacetoacetate isomerase [Novosphingobium soli]|uniref:Maleylacetoacetate isomerase n=1 Tax=Novosphingobium soli TaxID=574956 RepID=A0ABV6CPK5_9SPHN